jgi:NAD(P)-dependent dehydrogenase (short-subunit alcohol dehydrogenase family)
LEAALESMRYELLPFGVHISIIQPGYTKGTGLLVSGRAPGMATDSVYEPLLVANDAGHDEIRETAESPNLILEAVRGAMASDTPAFRYPLGEFGTAMTELGHAGDEEIMKAMTEVFGLEEWLAQGSRS